MSNVQPVDQPTRVRIASELDRNFLVEAGAGSGKTHSLADRMASAIARGVHQVDGMAAVTFTRKAASELRGRFQLALEARLSAGPSDDEAARLRAALADLERFFAGTIHGFCARLLRERPVEARVAPGFVEIDEVEDAVRRERAWRDFIVRESSRGSGPLRALRAAGVRAADLDHGFMLVCEHEDVTFPGGEIDAPSEIEAWAALGRFWETLRAELPHPVDPATSCKVQKLARDFQRRVDVARRDRPASLAQIFVDWETAKPVKKWWGTRDSRHNPQADQVIALVQQFQTTVIAPFLRDWRAWVYRQAVALLAEGRAFYAAERRRQNVVNYVDLLMMTARMLRENPGVRRALQRKYRWLFIDEFQDTDPIQAEVFLLLAADEARVDAAQASDLDWSLVPLRPGALFVVGDPKQSIYRFRRADIDTYTRVRDRIVACGGEVLALTANFRSVPAICDFVNRIFPRRFPEQPAPEAPVFERLEPVRAAEGTDSPVAKLTLPASLDKSDIPAAEAARIAQWIHAEVTSGRRDYGDILVLTRYRPRLQTYVAALEAAEIPVEVSGAGMFGGSEEVRTLRALIDALADPLDGLSLVGVLRGPLFGVRDADLYRYRAAGGRLELATPLPEPTADTSGIALEATFGPALVAMRQLHSLYHATRRLPLAAAIDRLLEDTGLLALAASTPGAAKAGDLLQAVDRVRQVAEVGGGLAEAAEALDAEVPEASDVESLPLEPGRHDVVRVMNLHKAKGLEAKVVFLADPCSGFQFKPDIRIVREGRQAVGWMQIIRRKDDSFANPLIAEPPDWQGHATIEQRYLAAEQERLYYVAATRARDRLIVGRVAETKDNKAWLALDPPVALQPELVVPAVSEVAAVGTPRPAREETRQLARRRRDERHARLAVPSWRVESVTEETHTMARATRIRKSVDPGTTGQEAIVGRADVDADPTRVLLPETPSHRADAGLAWGMLIHGLLEHAMQHPEAGDADLERLGRWLSIDHGDLRDVLPRAVGTVRAVMAAPFWAQATGSQACHVEVPFALRIAEPVTQSPVTPPKPVAASRPSPKRSPVTTTAQPSLFDAVDVDPAPRPDLPLAAPTPDAPDPGGVTVLRGVIDLVYEGPDGWHIVDYKTDQILVSVDELVPRYGAQVDRYREAWTLTSGRQVAVTELFHIRTVRAVAVPPAPAPVHHD